MLSGIVSTWGLLTDVLHGNPQLAQPHQSPKIRWVSHHETSPRTPTPETLNPNLVVLHHNPQLAWPHRSPKIRWDPLFSSLLLPTGKVTSSCVLTIITRGVTVQILVVHVSLQNDVSWYLFITNGPIVHVCQCINIKYCKIYHLFNHTYTFWINM